MIYAILMAGGMGTRLKVPEEKPLFKLRDKPLIKYVIDNLNASKLIDEIVIAVSPNTGKTTEYLRSWKFQNLGHFRQRLSKGLVLYIGLF